MTKNEALLVTAYTGVLCCDASSFHKFVEKRLGRSVWTHEMAESRFWDELKSLVRDEFLSICHRESNVNISGPQAPLHGPVGPLDNNQGDKP